MIRTSILILFFMPSLVHAAGERLIGSWKTSVDRTEIGLRASGIRDKPLLDRLKNVLGNRTVTYDGSHYTEFLEGKKLLELDYEVVAEDKDRITVRFRKRGSNSSWMTTLRMESDCYWDHALPFEGTEECFVRETKLASDSTSKR